MTEPGWPLDIWPVLLERWLRVRGLIALSAPLLVIDGDTFAHRALPPCPRRCGAPATRAGRSWASATR